MPIIRLQGEEEFRHHIHYELDTNLEPIGVGGMGRVYKGMQVDEHSGMKRPVAIKIMYDGLSLSTYERARREAAMRFHNDNLVEMLGFLETQETGAYGNTTHRFYVISELIEGVTLSELMKGKTTDHNGQGVPFAEKLLSLYHDNPDYFARTVVMNVAYGLMALHNAGYIHRDIDPSNIMVTRSGHIKLIDFGIAKKMTSLNTGDGLSVDGNFMGKPEYAAPELVIGDIKHQNQTTDIYALGILLYHCITGLLPFNGSRLEIMQNQLKGRMPLSAIGNRSLRRVIAKACEKKQEKRYQSVAQLCVAIEESDKPTPSILEYKKHLFAGAAVFTVLLLFIVLIPRLFGTGEKTEELDSDTISVFSFYSIHEDDRVSKILKTLSVVRPQLKEYVDGFYKGEPIATYRLAKCFETGDFLEGNRNLNIAGELVHKAADMGLADAQNTLGFYFFHGRAGYACNYDSATTWYKRAIQNGSLDAGYNLALAYDDGRYKGSKQNVKRTEEAFNLYRSIAEKGYAKSQAALGIYYYTSQNYSEAKKWLERSLNSSLPTFEASRVQFFMGQLYGTGKPGVEHNDKTAFEWYYKAATNGEGYLEALYYLGIYYQNGRGVEQNLSKAKEWYEKAAKRGHKGAKAKLRGKL